MTLDEAVKILRQHNITGASVQKITNGRTLEKDLLAQVLNACESLMTERTEYKRLLKVAVEDLNYTNDCVVCMYVKDNNCPDDRENCGFKWRYADEAKKLLNE